MFKNTYLKAVYQERRIIYMRGMKWCLEKFKETKNDLYWEWATKFGEWSKDTKKDIDEL